MSELIGDGWSPPPDVRDRVEFHWFHVPAGGSVMLGMLSPQPLWYVGHFHRGRMRRCVGEGCELCELGLGRQIRYVVCGVELSTRQVGVIEIGTSPGRVLQDACARNGGLRGMVVEVGKPAGSKHGRLDVSVLEERAPSWMNAMDALDLKEVLLKTWERAVCK